MMNDIGIAILAVSVAILAGCDLHPQSGSQAGHQHPGAVVTLTDANFEGEVLRGSQPVLVDFWAAWCRPCVEMKPMLRELAEEYAGRIKLGELNVEAHPFTTQKYDVATIPVLLLFREGKLLGRLDGRQTKAELVRLLDSALSPAEPSTAGR